MSRACLSFLCALGLLLATSCSMFSAQPKLDRLDLEFSNPEVSLPYGIRVRVGVRDPDGNEASAEGLGQIGSMVSTLCFDLCRRLERIGCMATYRDMDAPAEGEDTKQQLRREQRQTIELPEGWSFVFARTAATYPQEGHPKAKNAPGTHMRFTMRAAH